MVAVAKAPALVAVLTLFTVVATAIWETMVRTPKHSACVCHDFLGKNVKAGQRVRSKGRHNGHIRRIATASHQHSSNPWGIDSGIKNVPLAAEVCLEPAREIHRRIHRRNANVTQIACAVACWNVHAAAQRDSEMGKVAAHSGRSRYTSHAVLVGRACS